jgi:SHS family lactate transporter-like MFS transporter
MDEKSETEYTAQLGSGEPAQPQMSAGRYAATRFSTLMPTFDKAENPFKLLLLLNKQQWLFFLMSFFAWSWE